MFTWLHELLKMPEARYIKNNIGIDDVQTTVLHGNIIRKKGFLYKLFLENYGIFKENIKDKKFFRPYELYHLRGNAKKAAKHLKWKPKITFKKLVKIMVEADLKRWNDFLDGKVFPWDAPLYPDETKLITRISSRRKN